MFKNKDLKNAHAANDIDAEVSGLRSRERKIVTYGLLIVIFLAVQDFIEDYSEQIELQVIVADLVYVSVMVGLLIYIWRNVPMARDRQNRLLIEQIENNHREAEVWRNQAKQYIDGLGQMIDQQFSKWELTAAEKEVAMLLLKGFSLKDIAELRTTGERTVRQQAVQIYTKANLAGRAELSAFFLEDLMPASEIDPPS